jgi:hypothetical protein
MTTALGVTFLAIAGIGSAASASELRATLAAAGIPADAATAVSPDGRLALAIAPDGTGGMAYTLLAHGQALITNAALGLDFGAATDETGRVLDIPCGFLGSGTWTARIVEDANDAHYLKNREAMKTSTRTVTAADTIRVRLAPGGGACIILKP